jgi:hypothetical protein
VHCTHTLSHTLPGPGGFAATLTPHLSPLEVGTSYYAVAVVRRNSSVTINTLKGVKSCHTGVNRTVGWNVPVGYLVESGRLSVMGCDVLKGEDLGLAWDLCSPTLLPGGVPSGPTFILCPTPP